MKIENSVRGEGPNRKAPPLSKEEMAALRQQDQQLTTDLLAAVLNATDPTVLPAAAQRFRAERQRLAD